MNRLYLEVHTPNGVFTSKKEQITDSELEELTSVVQMAARGELKEFELKQEAALPIYMGIDVLPKSVFKIIFLPEDDLSFTAAKQKTKYPYNQ